MSRIGKFKCGGTTAEEVGCLTPTLRDFEAKSLHDSDRAKSGSRKSRLPRRLIGSSLWMMLSVPP